MSDSPAPAPAPVPGGTVAEPSGVLACPACGEPSPEGARFCEACGTPLAPLPTATGPDAGTGAAADLATDAATDPAAAGTGDGGPGSDDGTAAGTTEPTGGAFAETDGDGTESGARPCVRCGGRVAEDGYCTECGEPAASERDHWAERPASWVAGVCDRGVRHSRNEDAMALAASPSATAERAFAALVVCDGVSSAPDSAVASLAAA
ncbi:double zinc ribbon domain-containing protein, partial [Cellulosimicrobium funkei]